MKHTADVRKGWQQRKRHQKPLSDYPLPGPNAGPIATLLTFHPAATQLKPFLYLNLMREQPSHWVNKKGKLTKLKWVPPSGSGGGGSGAHQTQAPHLAFHTIGDKRIRYKLCRLVKVVFMSCCEKVWKQWRKLMPVIITIAFYTAAGVATATVSGLAPLHFLYQHSGCYQR